METADPPLGDSNKYGMLASLKLFSGLFLIKKKKELPNDLQDRKMCLEDNNISMLYKCLSLCKWVEGWALKWSSSGRDKLKHKY